MIKKIIAIIMLSVTIATGFSVQAMAADDKVNITKRDTANYAFDLEEVGVMEFGDIAINSMASVIFKFGANIVVATCNIYEFCDEFKLTDLFGEDDGINIITKSIKEELFSTKGTLFWIVTIALGFCLLPLLAKNNMLKIFTNIIVVILLCVTVTLVANNSMAIADGVNEIGAYVSNTFVTVMNGGDKGTAKSTSDTIWENLVVLPWQEAEFMGANESAKDNADSISSLSPSDPQRKDQVASLSETENAFKKEYAGDRLGFSLVYVIISIPKSLVYLALGCIQIVLKLMVALLVILSPLMFFLAIVPFFGGLNILISLLKKLVEMELYYIGVGVILGFILMLDRFSYNFIEKLTWFGVGIMQIGIIAIMFMFRNKLLSLVEMTGAKIINGNAGATVSNFGHGWSHAGQALEQKYDTANKCLGDKYIGNGEKLVTSKNVGRLASAGATAGMTGLSAVAHQSKAYNYVEDRVMTLGHIASSNARDRATEVKEKITVIKEDYSKKKVLNQERFNEKADKLIIANAPVVAGALYAGTSIDDFDGDRRDKARNTLIMPNKSNLPDYDDLPPPLEQMAPMDTIGTKKIFTTVPNVVAGKKINIEYPESLEQMAPMSVSETRKMFANDNSSNKMKGLSVANVEENPNNVVKFPTQHSISKPTSNARMYVPSSNNDVVKKVNIAIHARNSYKPHQERELKEAPRLDKIVNAQKERLEKQKVISQKKNTYRTQDTQSKNSDITRNNNSQINPKAINAKNKVRGETLATKQAQLSSKQSATL